MVLGSEVFASLAVLVISLYVLSLISYPLAAVNSQGHKGEKEDAPLLVLLSFKQPEAVQDATTRLNTMKYLLFDANFRHDEDDVSRHACLNTCTAAVVTATASPGLSIGIPRVTSGTAGANENSKAHEGRHSSRLPVALSRLEESNLIYLDQSTNLTIDNFQDIRVHIECRNNKKNQSQRRPRSSPHLKCAPSSETLILSGYSRESNKNRRYEDQDQGDQDQTGMVKKVVVCSLQDAERGIWRIESPVVDIRLDFNGKGGGDAKGGFSKRLALGIKMIVPPAALSAGIHSIFRIVTTSSSSVCRRKRHAHSA